MIPFRATGLPNAPKAPAAPPRVPILPPYRTQPPLRIAGGAHSIQATLAGRPVGSVQLHPQPNGGALLTNLRVAPEHRGAGVGASLVRAAVQASAVQGRPRVQLEARPDPHTIPAPALAAMYRKLGFRQTGISQRGNPLLEWGPSAAVPAARVPGPRAPLPGRSPMPVQARMAPAIPRRLPPPAPLAVVRGVLQRMKLSDLASVASKVNESHSGRPESRNTQAIVETKDGQTVMFSQREYSAFDEALQEAEEEHGATIDERVIGDSKDDEGIHAEMLAVSWWLQDKIAKPVKIGVSQGICARCQEVLDLLGIKGTPAGGHYTKNWVHPYRHAGMTPSGKLKKIPQKVTRGKEYSW